MMIFKTTGTCDSEIKIKINNRIIEKVGFVGGCDGN